ncbi:high-potential iron-sulfur protein [Neisseria sp. Ec49-e6-T10]|uniref:high-potential iron-sulfur protein n=1 Tax=Neisseria sp. Ec49-e6-T10 TaxID=3140744 RepID=UPI003EB86C27
MKNFSRRQFLLGSLATTGTVLFFHKNVLAAPVYLNEKDPMATRLGYKEQTTQVDGNKYPKHDNSQSCANCTLYQGNGGDAAGGCSLFAGKFVAKDGWCMSWAKKG